MSTEFLNYETKQPNENSNRCLSWPSHDSTGQAKINVVATLPDFAAIAREVGGDNVDVTVLAKATEDPHFVDARPSFVVKLRQADVLIDGGAELEIGWLPPLLQNARNPKIEVGQPGRVQASQGIRLMEVPAQLTRAAGDVHAMGNPHFMVDPIIAKAVAQHIANASPRSIRARRRLPDERKEIRSHDQRQAPGMGSEAAPVSRAKPRRLPRFLALFCAPLWLSNRRFPRAKAGHSTVPLASRGGHRADEGTEDQGNHRRALPQPENR